MVIQWYGQSCFKINSGDLVIAIDPFSKEIGLTPPRFRTDILLKTHDHYDHSNTESIPDGSFIIDGPGEYELKGVPIVGIETYHDSSKGAERGKNTVYKFEVEEIKLAHLGDFGEKEIRPETLEALGDVDILLIPVGGIYTINSEVAVKIIRQIEPRLVIPMHYKIPGLKINPPTFSRGIGPREKSLKTPLTLTERPQGVREGGGIKLDDVGDFLKEIGAKGLVAEEKLVIKKKDLPEEEKIKVVVLKAVAQS